MEDELGEALSSVHRARRSLTSLACVRRVWIDVGRQRAALERTRAVGFALIGAGGTGADDTTEQRVWFSAPDRSRCEGGGATTVLRDGERWVVPDDPSAPVVHDRAPRGTRGRSIGSPAPPPDPLQILQPLVDARTLCFVCDLEATGRVEREGRAAIELVGTPRDDLDPMVERAAQLELHGADRVVLHVDAELGVLLRLEHQLDGHPFRVDELRSVRAGHRVSAARFELDLTGREVISAEERMAQLQAQLPSTHRPEPHCHEITGPPPADEPTAEAAIQAALDRLFGPHETDVPGVEGGEDLGRVLGMARERNRDAVEGASLRLRRVRFLHDRLAEIRFELVTASGGAGAQQDGFAFEQDGEWLISRETLAALVAVGGVRIPPRTVGLDPPGHDGR